MVLRGGGSADQSGVEGVCVRGPEWYAHLRQPGLPYVSEGMNTTVPRDFILWFLRSRAGDFPADKMGERRGRHERMG